MTQKTLFWFRQDLRLFDNPGLYEAAKAGEVMAVYIFDEDHKGHFGMGSASKWWLHHSLAALNKKLDHKLSLYQGNSQEIILKLVKDHSIEAVYWNRRYEPLHIKVDAEIKSALKHGGIECKSYNASLLREPWEVLKNDGTSYKVFTPYYQKGYFQAAHPRKPLPVPEKLTLLKDTSHSTTLAALSLLPTVKWDASLAPHWIIGEDGAQEKFADFLENGLVDYKEGRDFPAKVHTSRLSPHLHFGEISPHYLWHSIHARTVSDHIPENDKNHFLREIGWREFSYYLLYYFPDLPTHNLQNKFDTFSWQTDDALFKNWQQGQTGYPIVDAGMRQLWQTGYMHNRIRMIVGSFLVKNLLLDWRQGQEWFWDCLVDADLASNSANWQWIAGSGADAVPYFRIFNPITQGEKFDPKGVYTRHFVPELKEMPDAYLFRPWEAPPAVLVEAGVILGQTYPKPIVDLKISRQQALKAYHSLSKSAASP